MKYYCTFFDHRYMSRGLVMIRSLRQQEPDAEIWVLCLDGKVRDTFKHKPEPGVRAISQSVFDAGDSELAAAKQDGRSLVEYYFSLKPSLIAHVLRDAPEAETVTYLDADLWFFASPQPIFAEAPGGSVFLTAHRFPPNRKSLECFGKYNAGWLSFRRSSDGLACLSWWRARCMEWCHDQADEEGDRYADQRYLDHFAALFGGVHAVYHKGANLAPWNLGRHALSVKDGVVLVDNTDPLLFFHVHGLKPLGYGFYISPADTFDSGPDRLAQDVIYRPYLLAVGAVEQELAPFMPPARKPIQGLARSSRTGLTARLKQKLRIARAALRGNLIRVTG